jgi:hypothetical protein
MDEETVQNLGVLYHCNARKRRTIVGLPRQGAQYGQLGPGDLDRLARRRWLFYLH